MDVRSALPCVKSVFSDSRRADAAAAAARLPSNYVASIQAERTRARRQQRQRQAPESIYGGQAPSINGDDTTKDWTRDEFSTFVPPDICPISRNRHRPPNQP